MGTNSNINVAGLDFAWNLEQGQFIFEGQDAVLFWISTAMREFFDTIEEISGEEASSLVCDIFRNVPCEIRPKSWTTESRNDVADLCCYRYVHTDYSYSR